MKKNMLSMLALSLFVFSSQSIAYCPSNLSAESTVDCIVTESANEVQDDFRWDEVVAGLDQASPEQGQQAHMLALDNE